MAIAFDDVRRTYDDMELRAGRVMIIKPDQVGQDEPGETQYSRCTTFIDALTSAFALMKWEQRKILAGIVARPALVMEAGAHLDDVVGLDEVITRAKEAAQSSDAANAGTAMHKVYEDLDRGKPMDEILQRIPAEYHQDVFSRQRLVEGLRWDQIESRVVLDTFKVTGTPDRIGTFPARHPRFKGLTFPDGRPISGKTTVIDDKTGKIEDYNILKVAMQLAVYARSWSYDRKTGKRTPHGADTQWALVIHNPVGGGVAKGMWVDLTKGWQAVQLAKAVRESRNLKVKQLCHPFEPPRGELAIESTGETDALTSAHTEAAAITAEQVDIGILIQREIESCTTVEELVGVYELHKDTYWDSSHAEAATMRRQQIEVGRRG